MMGGIVNTPQVANQAPTPQNTPVVPNAVTNLTQMTDPQLAQLVMQSKQVDMPNHLNDVANNAVQQFVYMAGVNELPTVLDQATFDQYLVDNNIPRSEILSRSTGGANYTVNGTTIRLSPDQTTDLLRYGQLNYVGGKQGGAMLSFGAYFAMNGGANTGYSNGATMIGVLNPQTARPITYNQLARRTNSWANSHPQTARAVGAFSSRNASIYALMQGYNVITDSGKGYNQYNNVIDRSALVLRQNNL